MAENDTLLREVDDEVRRDRMQAMWRQYRTPLIVGVAALILATAGTSIWNDYQEKKAGEAMVELDRGTHAFEEGKFDDAANAFASVGKNATGELHDVAKLWEARAQIAAKHDEKAIALLTDLAKNPAGNELIWRDMACLRLMGANAPVPDACTTSSDSPLKHQREEWHAALLWQQGKTNEARALLQSIADDEAAPQAQRDRATQLLSAVTDEAK